MVDTALSVGTPAPTSTPMSTIPSLAAQSANNNNNSSNGVTDNNDVDMNELLSDNENKEEEENDDIVRDKLEQLIQDKDKEDEAFLDRKIEEGVQDERDLEEGGVIDDFKHTPEELETLRSMYAVNPHTNKIRHKK